MIGIVWAYSIDSAFSITEALSGANTSFNSPCSIQSELCAKQDAYNQLWYHSILHTTPPSSALVQRIESPTLADSFVFKKVSVPQPNIVILLNNNNIYSNSWTVGGSQM